MRTSTPTVDIGACGKIVPTWIEDVEQIVGQFKAEIDGAFPGHTTEVREGKWQVNPPGSGGKCFSCTAAFLADQPTTTNKQRKSAKA